ncbi:MAG: hypothetical protein EU548_03005 [Promethearchaeota archaeon]|nr:MAG: hypothetical protein EU548_03005 [Candidatus Lokiarchaeota archaeon]
MKNNKNKLNFESALELIEMLDLNEEDLEKISKKILVVLKNSEISNIIKKSLKKSNFDEDSNIHLVLKNLIENLSLEKLNKLFQIISENLNVSEEITNLILDKIF